MNNAHCYLSAPTGKTRSTVNLVPDVVGALVDARFTVGRVLFFVLLLASGCDEKADKNLADAGPSSQPSSPPQSCKTHCRMAGLCVWSTERDRCVAESSEQCAASNSCKTSGLCEKERSVCIGTKAAHCAESQRCKSDGLCTFTHRGVFPCQAAGDDCRESKACKRHGRCGVLPDGTCQVTKDEDCSAASVCTRHGQCSAKASWKGDMTVRVCAAVTNDDCANGADCTERGQCTAANSGCR